MENCDMCGHEIINGRCSCGKWRSKDELKDNPILASLEMFHGMRKMTLTSECPHLGCSVVFFRGDYNDCKKVEDFIYKLKGRPYYDEE